MTIASAKDQLRATAKTARARAALDHPEAAAELSRIALSLDVLNTPAVIAGYLPIGDEIDPRPLMESWQNAGHSLALPVVTGDGQALTFRSWMPDAPLESGPHGTRHPAKGTIITPDVVLVPLLAFDRQGYRLGWGGGYYDRTLAGLKTIAIGVAYAAQEVASVPHDHYDQSLDWIVTEQEVIRSV